MIVTLIVFTVALLLSLVFIYYAITEKDLLKAAVFSAGQSVCYAILLHTMAAPDIAMTYLAVSVGLYSALLVFVISKTERYEE
jgi:energy-converting hydrogenase B subunit D